MPYCPNCGEEVSERSRYCGNCGTDVSDVPRESGGDSGWGGNQSEWGSNNQPGHAGDQRTDRSPAGHQQQRGGPQQGHQSGPQQGQSSTPGQGHTQGPSNALDFSFGFPKKNGWEPVLISTGMVLLGFLIVPALILAGYGFRVARWAATDQPQPPEYNDWGKLVVDGLRFGVLYMVLPVVWLFAFLLGGAALVEVTGAGVLGGLFVFVGYFGSFLVPNVFLTAFIGTNSVIGMFTDMRWKDLLTSVYFWKALLFFVALMIIFQILLLFSLFTIVGWIVVYAYTVLAFGAYWGYVYREAANRGIVPPAEGIGPSQHHQQPQY